MTTKNQESAELLKLFGNDTRQRILQTLWEHLDLHDYVTRTQAGLSFTELRERAGVSDSGNFNYHIGRLTGKLVEKQDGEYVLTPLGYNLMRSIQELRSFSYEVQPEQRIDTPCPFCGGDLVTEYRRELVRVRCCDCGGLSGGELMSARIRATATDLGMRQLLDRAVLNLFSRLRKSRYGVCWNCLNRLEQSLVVCGDHQRREGGACAECLTRHRVRTRVECQNCDTSDSGPLLEYAVTHPVTMAFFHRHGTGPAQRGPWRYWLAAFENASERLVENSPTTVGFEFEHAKESCLVTVCNGSETLSLEAESL